MKPKINIGYVSLFTLFLLTVLLMIGGFYGWEKYQQKKYPEKATQGEIKGPGYYLSQIQKEISLITRKRDIRNKRAIELVESVKTVRDKAELYSLEIPQSWVIVLSESKKDNKISNLVMQSSYFSASETNGKRYYNAGAKFSVVVTAGKDKNVSVEDGGHANTIKIGKDKGEKKEYVYHIFKDPDSEDGQIINSHIVYNGNTYLFTMIYNPKFFTDAEHTFKEIMYSVKFK